LGELKIEIDIPIAAPDSTSPGVESTTGGVPPILNQIGDADGRREMEKSSDLAVRPEVGSPL
jgi:hypothetical protein